MLSSRAVFYRLRCVIRKIKLDAGARARIFAIDFILNYPYLLGETRAALLIEKARLIESIAVPF